MIKLVIGLFVPFLFFFFIKSQYSIMQAEHYEINRYFKYEFKKKVLTQSILISLLLMVNYNYIYDVLILLISIIINLNFMNTYSLKFTPRVKRFFVLSYFLIYLIFVIVPFNNLVSFIFINNLMFFIMLIGHFLSAMLESIIMKRYIKEAKRIIKDKTIIGITGSYGKTTCKNIIYDLLEKFCNVSKTPKSYNNRVGIVKSIRENVNEFDDMFICEYGVDRKGGMDKLLKIVKPNVSLITEIGPQHLLTFKNINNIVNEKIKLANILNDNEFVVINNDNKYLKEVSKQFKCKVITYGIENKSDIMAKNIKVSKEGISFDLYINDKRYSNLNVKLLGEHNVLNVLGAIGILCAMNIDLKKALEYTRNIKPISHRLELKNISGIKVIDDSFNSNEVGFKKAIDILKLMDEEKIVVTPGIIEQGVNGDKVNYELGEYMADKIDLVFLVEKNAKTIKAGLLSKGFEEEKIIIKGDFNDAWRAIKEMKNKNKKIVLIENDLPSIYLK